MKKYTGAIFDLDGVLVDTAIFHYMAWKELAGVLEIPFDFQDNERLKGVSRMECLSILLSLAVPGTKSDRSFLEDERRQLSKYKNNLYVEKICDSQNLAPLPGVVETLRGLRRKNIRIAVASSSKNAPLIIVRLGMEDDFDVIADGRQVVNSKPDPEIFLLAAKKLDISPERCIVFEDSAAGIIAAQKAGMYSVGIGLQQNLAGADLIIPTVNPDKILPLFD